MDQKRWKKIRIDLLNLVNMKRCFILVRSALVTKTDSAESILAEAHGEGIWSETLARQNTWDWHLLQAKAQEPIWSCCIYKWACLYLTTSKKIQIWLKIHPSSRYLWWHWFCNSTSWSLVVVIILGLIVRILMLYGPLVYGSWYIKKKKNLVS